MKSQSSKTKGYKNVKAGTQIMRMVFLALIASTLIVISGNAAAAREAMDDLEMTIRVIDNDRDDIGSVSHRLELPRFENDDHKSEAEHHDDRDEHKEDSHDSKEAYEDSMDDRDDAKEDHDDAKDDHDDAMEDYDDAKNEVDDDDHEDYGDGDD